MIWQNVLRIAPNDECNYVDTEDVIKSIEDHKDEICLIWLSGVHYFTGQYMDIARITECAHKHNIVIGWELAHSAGNVDLHLHEWYVCRRERERGGGGVGGGMGKVYL